VALPNKALQRTALRAAAERQYRWTDEAVLRYLFVVGAIVSGIWLARRATKRRARRRFTMSDGRDYGNMRERDWERRFPALDDEWNLWWIEGDGDLLAVIPASGLTEALEIVRRHRSDFSSIVVSVAKRDSFGEIVCDRSRGWVIASKEGARLDE
jgi:hypothetical protein